MRYWPLPSDTALRTFSISAGLDTSTVTPGSTAPDPSVTMPAIVACCADANVGRATLKADAASRRSSTRRMRVNLDSRTDMTGAARGAPTLSRHRSQSRNTTLMVERDHLSLHAGAWPTA